jgi:RHS repeat-associated protein
LALEYNSSAGNSLFGMVWRLAGLPAISINTRKSLPKYNGSDGYVFGGSEELIPLLQQTDDEWQPRIWDQGCFWVQCFRSTVDHTRIRFERWTHKTTGRVHWRSRDSSNTLTVYGFHTAGLSRVADPDAEDHTYLWLPEAQYTPNGNVIRYEYAPEDRKQVDAALSYEHFRLTSGSVCAQRYIKRIRYGNTRPLQPDEPAPPDNEWLFEVVFDYGDHSSANLPKVDPDQLWSVRLDPFSDYRCGFEIRTYRQCRRVLMFHRFKELGPGPTLVGSTCLEYSEDPAGSTLRSISYTAYRREPGGSTWHRSLPPLWFTYTFPSLGEVFLQAPQEARENVPHGLAGTHCRWLDLLGEGLAGILTETSQAWYYKPNEGNGHFGPQQCILSKPSPQMGRYTLGDFDHNGNTDLLIPQGRQAGCYELDRDDGSWSGFQPFSATPHLESAGARVQWLDLNGDGRPDLLISNHNHYTWYPSAGKEGFDSPIEVPKAQAPGPAELPEITENPDLHYFFADMNGDGLLDQVRIQNGRVEYWPHLGHGRFGDAVLMQGAPFFDSDVEFDANRLRLVDLDGNGTTDLVYIGRGEVRYWINASGNELVEGACSRGLPFIDNSSSVRILDFLGDGTACLVWSSPLPGHASPIQYLQLTNGVRPRLLVSIDNSLGMETRLTYGTSAAHYLRDKRTGRGWATKLPSHPIVVDRKEVIDHIGHSSLVGRYEYHDGCFDSEERVFLGFGQVDQYDAELNSDSAAETSVTPTCVRTWFHMGTYSGHQSQIPEYYTLDHLQVLLQPHVLEDPNGLLSGEYEQGMRALVGQVLRQEVFALESNGRRADHPYQVTQSSYCLRRLQPSAQKHDACFTFDLRERVTYDYEQQPQDPRIAHHLSFDWDAFGNVLLEGSVAYARRPSNPIASDSQRRSTVTAYKHRFANFDGADRYELGIPVEHEDFEMSGLSADAECLLTVDELREALRSALVTPLAHHQAFSPGSTQARRLEWDRSFYWNDNLSDVLPLGQVGARSLVHHEESACFTSEFIADVFGGRVADPMLVNEGGYVLREGHLWQGDPVQHYLPASAFYHLARLERWDGARTSYRYDDPYFLTLVEVRDSLGNSTRGETDYHLIAPCRIVDPNDNVAEVAYDPLGVTVASTTHGEVLGSAGNPVPYGQTPLADYARQPDATLEAVLAEPGRFIQQAGQFRWYDLNSWLDYGIPPRTLALVREEYLHDGRGGTNPESRIQTAITYTDGFGRTLQSKLLVEPGPAIQRDSSGRVVVDANGVPIEAPAPERWLVSGHVVYDAKQQPVRQYEPYYSPGYAFEPDEELVHFGVSEQFHYDAVGRQIRQDFPNGTYSKVEYLPWEVRRYDANDTVLDSAYRAERIGLPDTDREKRALLKAQAHANTPVVVYLDPEGREVKQVETGAAGQNRVSESTLDARGNVIQTVDARGLTAFLYRYDMLGRALYTRSIDAGETWTLLDGLDRPIHQWDGRGVHQRHQFDVLDRPISVWVDGALWLGQMVEQFTYGEDPSVSQAALRNARGELVMHRDQAGVLTIQQYGPEGNVLRSERQLRSDYKAEPDWMNPGAVSLEPTVYISETGYDALGRVRWQALPDGTLRTTEYLRGGGVERVVLSTTDGTLTDQVVFNSSGFNARGQRSEARLGNGVQIAYRYDARTFGTTRIMAWRPQGPNGQARTLQDLDYTYDPVGNITYMVDHAQQPAGSPSPVIQGLTVSSHAEFTYDSFYQLIAATGRVHQAILEHDYRPGLLHPGGLKGTRHISLNNGQAIERYTRTYEYDLAGNIKRIRHQGVSQSWTTDTWISPASNRSLLARDPAGNPVTNPEAHYDAGGNCIALPHLRAMDWSYRNSLTRAVVIDRSASSQPDDAEFYVYGGDGLRVRKVWERLVDGEVVITEKIYLDGCEIKRIRRANQVLLERTTSDISDGSNRIALVYRWTQDAHGLETDAVGLAKIHYQLNNHLGSSALELDERGEVITYEEYFPYGGTAFMAGDNLREVDLKEYRYSGKERDDATGFYHYGYRYYAPWLGHWLSPDPLGPEDVLNLYQFVLNNPVNLLDPNGLQAEWQPRKYGVYPAFPRPAEALPEQAKEYLRQKYGSVEAIPKGEAFLWVQSPGNEFVIAEKPEFKLLAEQVGYVFLYSPEISLEEIEAASLSFAQSVPQLPSGETSVQTPSGDEGDDSTSEIPRGPQGAPADNKDKPDSTDEPTVNNASGKGNGTATPPAEPGHGKDADKKGTGQGRGAREGIDLGAGPGQIPGTGSSQGPGGQGKGKSAAQDQNGTGEDTRRVPPTPPPTTPPEMGQGKEESRSTQTNLLPPIISNLLAPFDSLFKDPNGSQYGNPFATRGGTGSVGGGKGEGSQPGPSGTLTGQLGRVTGKDPAGMWLVKLCGYLNLSFGGDKNGQAGGIPGGGGQKEAGTGTRVLFVLATLALFFFPFGLIMKGPMAFLRGALSLLRGLPGRLASVVKAGFSKLISFPSKAWTFSKSAWASLRPRTFLQKLKRWWYPGRGHHTIIPRGGRGRLTPKGFLRNQWGRFVPKFFRESRLNVIDKGPLWHYRVDPYFRGTASWRAPAGIAKYGMLGRLWYGSPGWLRGIFLGLVGANVYLLSQNESVD